MIVDFLITCFKIYVCTWVTFSLTVTIMAYLCPCPRYISGGREKGGRQSIWWYLGLFIFMATGIVPILLVLDRLGMIDILKLGEE